MARVPLRTPSRSSLWRQRTRSPTRNSRSPTLERARARAGRRGHEQRAGGVVEVADVGAPVGEHHVAGEVVLGGLPPVLEQPLLGGGRVVVDVEAAAPGGVGEVGLGVAAAQLASASPFERVALAAVLGELDRAEPFAEGGEEPAGADRRQLLRVADQERLPLRPLDELEQRREHPRLGHAGLVDDEHAAARETALALGVEQQPVQGAAGDAGAGGELVGGRPLGAAPSTGTPLSR